MHVTDRFVAFLRLSLRELSRDGRDRVKLSDLRCHIGADEISGRALGIIVRERLNLRVETCGPHSYIMLDNFIDNARRTPVF